MPGIGADPGEGEAAATEPVDLRMVVVGAGAWAGGLLAHAGLPRPWLLVAWLVVLGLALVFATRARTTRALRRTVLATLLVALAVGGVTALRAEAITTSPVAELAADGAVVHLEGRVVADPRVREGPYGDQVILRLQVQEVTGRGMTHTLRAPVLVIGDPGWRAAPLGAQVSTAGRLMAADGGDLAAVVVGSSDPELIAEPDVWWRGAETVRASIRDSVAHRPADQSALVPALVDGDDAGMAPDLESDFRTTGLTHLTAVSGTNLTLVVGFLLILARWGGVRRRGLYLVGAAGIVGFVLLARTEPSVLRAAVMGTVGLLAMGVDGRHRALRGLGVALVVLLLIQPSLAISAGFALSVLATAGIVILAPGWRDSMMRWLPRWLAEAIAVPAAAQLACTPVVAAISGQVSIVAVVANLLVAPVVGPATVLGLAGGLVGLLADLPGRLLGTGAGWCVGWIVLVARRGADLPVAAIGWGTGPVALLVLTILALAVALLAPLVLRHRAAGPVVVLLLVVVVAVPLPSLPTPGWPARGWVVAMCDVGQGDALVLRAGAETGVVVDVGPDPELVDGCLSDLGVRRVPLVVLTHFHADHVDGLAGVLRGREVEQIATTNLLDPISGAEQVLEVAGETGVASVLAPYGQTRTYGDVTLQVLWPRPEPEGAVGARDGVEPGSAANDASVVLLAEVEGVRILLTGDLEPPGQTSLARDLVGLDVDVLKVPHHGSRFQDVDWLRSLTPEIALVSVGADNTYGHPSPEILSVLTDDAVEVARTDESGDVLVTSEGAGGVATHGRDP